MTATASGASVCAAAPVGVQTDRQGHFLIKGLQPKQAYQLTVQTRLDGREVGGQVYARTGSDRSQFVRVSLVRGADGVEDARKFPRDGAGVLTSLTESDGLVELPDDTIITFPTQTRAD